MSLLSFANCLKKIDRIQIFDKIIRFFIKNMQKSIVFRLLLC